MNHSILYNCNIEVENNFLLKSLAACEGSETKTDLKMHFTMNSAFMNYFNDMIEELGGPFFYQPGEILFLPTHLS